MGTCHRLMALVLTIVGRAVHSIEERAERSIVAEAVAIVGRLVAGSIGSIVVLAARTVCSSDQLESGCAGLRYHKLGSLDTCWGQRQLGTWQPIGLMHMQREPG